MQMYVARKAKEKKGLEVLNTKMGEPAGNVSGGDGEDDAGNAGGRGRVVIGNAAGAKGPGFLQAPATMNNGDVAPQLGPSTSTIAGAFRPMENLPIAPVQVLAACVARRLLEPTCIQR